MPDGQRAARPSFWVGLLGLLGCAASSPSDGGEGDCKAERLPFGGLCPSTELVCPPCPAATPIKCPSGGCVADVRRCRENVWLRGTCNHTTCEGVHFCHTHRRMTHVCWEVWPSTHNATLVFQDMGVATCGTCEHVWSRYPCAKCCGTRAVASWSGSHSTTAEARRGGGVFMQGSRCALSSGCLQHAAR